MQENGAQLYGPRVSNFLSHRIVKSLTFRIYGKLKVQCTRNGTQNTQFCPGSIQDAFIICSSISRHQMFQNKNARRNNIENRKSGAHTARARARARARACARAPAPACAPVRARESASDRPRHFCPMHFLRLRYFCVRCIFFVRGTLPRK